MKFRAPRGTQDVLPDRARAWQLLESRFRDLCRRYGYDEIRTPVFEETELFARGVGEDTELVSKQMYSFTDRGERQLTLRAEGTAPVVRAYLEHGLGKQAPLCKLFYIGPIFRYDRPQAGRYRQHTQLGVEALGAPGPEIDAEVIALLMDFLAELGVAGTRLELNSIGCPKCRPGYREALRQYLAPVRDQLCEFCQRRYEDNPLRILDDKTPRCRELAADAPSVLDHLCPECREHFAGLQRLLGELGIAFHVNPRIVRGLDYYARTAFELTYGPAAQNSLAGGGRYDGLAEDLGGDPTPGIGFGCGLERLHLALEEQGWAPAAAAPAVFVAAAGETVRAAALRLTQELRRAGVAAETDFLNRSLKAQMREAGRKGCPGGFP